MDLTLTEAAQLSGKTHHQIRYLLRTGRLAARKSGGRWWIRREDLPLSGGQRAAGEHKLRKAERIAEEVLDAGTNGSKSYSIQKLRAIRKGVPLFAQLVAAVGAEHPASICLREALMLLACGCHEYCPSTKIEFYSRAREQVSRATMSLALERATREGGGGEASHGVDSDELTARLEQTLLPAIGGLIRRAESWQRRDS